MSSEKISERTLLDLGWPKLLGALSRRAMTPLGAERALELPFLPGLEGSRRRFALVEESRGLLREELPIPVMALEDVESLLVRASKRAVLSAGEVLGCGRLIRCASDVRKFLRSMESRAPGLAVVSEALPSLMTVASRIERTIAPNGLIRDDASYELQMYREQARTLHRQMKQKIESFLGDSHLDNALQDEFYSVRGERYVLPIRSAERSRVPGIIHNASNSGETVFIEPQALVPLGNELTIAQSCIQEEEEKVLAEFSADIGAHAVELGGALETLAELDVIQASARLSEDLDAHVPVLVKVSRVRADEGDLIDLKGLRHPLLVLQGEPVVPNELCLGEEKRGMIISGPNAGGKTVSMTAVGLAALMVRAGLPIAAGVGSRFPCFLGVISAVGDAQDMEQHLSTFSAHLKHLGGALREACDDWLVLVDEIAADTDPVEGAALAQAVVEELVGQGALVIVTTHLEEIKALGINDPRFVNARVGLHPKTGQPNYVLEPNVAGMSNALDVAERMGLPLPVLARAREYLCGSGALTMALTKLEEQARDNRELGEGLERDRRRLKGAREEVAELRRGLERERLELELKIRGEMAEELDAVRRQAREVLSELRRAPGMKEVQKRDRELRAAREALVEQEEVLKGALKREEDPGLEPLPLELRPGMKVVLASLNQQGEIIEVEGERVVVLMGSLKMSAKRSELLAVKPGSGEGKRKKVTPRAREAVVADYLETPEVRCDLRGLRAEDALIALESFLDRSYQKGVGELVLLHGHGTGALKRVVRESLEISPYIKGFRPGKSHEGGDGVTVVTVDC